MPSKALVVDANILVRAVLGRRVREVIETYCERVSFFVCLRNQLQKKEFRSFWARFLYD